MLVKKGVINMPKKNVKTEGTIIFITLMIIDLILNYTQFLRVLILKAYHNVNRSRRQISLQLQT